VVHKNPPTALLPRGPGSSPVAASISVSSTGGSTPGSKSGWRAGWMSVVLSSAELTRGA
jgi:hypothetical protein